MTTTVQQILDRTLDRSTANDASLYASATREILTRVDRAQQLLFTRLADDNRYYYTSSQVVGSTNGASGRSIDLATLTPVAERLLLLLLPNGTKVNPVDLQDLNAELAPRFYPSGSRLVEVGTDWGASGIVNLTVDYVTRPAALDLAGAFTQLVSVPDRFCDYLECDLAAYMVRKDFGRAQAGEADALEAEREAAYGQFVAFLSHLSGPSSRHFVLPVPPVGEKA